MKNSTVVLYHANCTDGLVAAFMAHYRFRRNAKYIPVNYNKPVPHEATLAKNVFIVDFCFPLTEMLALISSTQEKKGVFVVLDHHETQKEVMRHLRKFDGPNIDIIYNKNMSGAGLAFHYFVANELRKDIRKMRAPKKSKFNNIWAATEYDRLKTLANFVQDRDLWKYSFPSTRDFSFWLFQNPMTFKTLDRIVALNDIYSADCLTFDDAIKEGAVIAEYHDSIVASYVEQARPIYLKNKQGEVHKGLYVYCHDKRLVSDVGNMLSRKSKTFGAVVGFSTNPNEFMVGLRSSKRHGNFDCTKLALNYGGGGHKNASGCRFTHEQLQEVTKAPEGVN